MLAILSGYQLYLAIPIALLLAVCFKWRFKTPIGVMIWSVISYGAMCFAQALLQYPIGYVAYLILWGRPRGTLAVDMLIGMGLSALIAGSFAWFVMKKVNKSILAHYAS